MKTDKDYEIEQQYLKEGWNSYFSGLSEHDCPYDKYTTAYVAWNDGYFDALMTDCGRVSHFGYYL